MKLSKYGFSLDLLGFSSFLSVLGIVVSSIGMIGGIALFVVGSYDFPGREYGPVAKFAMVVYGRVLLTLMIPYLIMWIFLKIKTSKQDILSIEKIGKVYSYLVGSLEIIGMITQIIFSMPGLFGSNTLQSGLGIGSIICSATYLIFTCLKIHGTRVKNNKLLGTYLGFRYVLSILSMIAAIIVSFIIQNVLPAIIFLIVGIVFFTVDVGPIVILHSIRVDRENTASQQQDHQVDKMKLTKFGFRLNLLGFSSILSVHGIVASSIEIIRLIYSIVSTSQSECEIDGYDEEECDFYRGQTYVIGSVLLTLMIPYLIIWIILKIKTSNQDIPSIENIAKVYSYGSGSLEIMVVVSRLIFYIYYQFGPSDRDLPSHIGFIIGSAIFIIFACLKISGIIVKNNKLLEIYLGFYYALLVLYMFAFIIFSILIFTSTSLMIYDYVPVIGLEEFIIGIIYFILNIGLTVILHSIRVDRENTAETEVPMKNI